MNRAKKEFRVILVSDIPPGNSPYRLACSQGHPPADKANDFLDALCVRGLSERTLRSYAYDLRDFFGWLSTTALTTEMLKENHLLDYIRYQRQGRSGHAAPTTINRRLKTACMFFRYLVGHDIPAGPGSSRPRASIFGHRTAHLAHLHRQNRRYTALRVKVPHRVIQPLSDDEAVTFLESMRTWRDRSIVYLMLLCGLRSCEVVALNLDNLSFSDGSVRVKGKGDKERVIPLPAEARRALSNYLHLERPAESSSALFVVLKAPNRGGALTSAGLRSLFRHHRLISGIKKANPHRLRHTFASNMARAGMPLPVLMRLMGHCQIEMTMRYIELFPTHVRDEFLRVTNNLRKKESPDED